MLEINGVSTPKDTANFRGAPDIAICGAGLGGMLTALRLSKLLPDKTISILDKDPNPAGRLRTSNKEKKTFASGAHLMPSSLWEILLRIGQDWDPDFNPQVKVVESVGVLAGKNISHLPFSNLGLRAGAEVIGGRPAGRDWETSVEQGLKKELSDQEKRSISALSKSTHVKRKKPAGVVIGHMASLAGVPDAWSSSPKSLLERMEWANQKFYLGDWSQIFSSLLEKAPNIEICSDTLVTAAVQKENGNWQLKTNQGVFESKFLVVGTSPWETIKWMDKNLMPIPILNLALKSKPTSIVTYAVKLKQPLPNLGEMTYIAAENCTALYGGDHEICFVCHLDYELSLSAPEVVKAVKRMRRSCKKLLAYLDLDQEVVSFDHISLLPVGWTQSGGHMERALIQKINLEILCKETLIFVGDSYGPSLNSDENLSESVQNAIEYIARQTKPGASSK